MTSKKHGGIRPGSGRPKGTGKFKSPTKTIRVPVDMQDDIVDFIDSNGYSVPYYSSLVQAGYPTQVANENLPELLNVFDTLVANPSHTYIVRATGESMINAGIHDGDMMVVDRKTAPMNNQIVIAAINAELTVKRLVQKDGKTYLMPENDAFEPILVTKEDDIKILGVVKHSIHSL